jgi:hypothetical protein
MAIKTIFLSFSLGLGAALLGACASQPAQAPATNPAPAAPASAPAPAPAANNAATETEAHTATAMEKRFQEAARGYKIVQKNGKTMYCKREKLIGTTIPTMNCISEAELRTQVENMEDYRQRARSSGRCVRGPAGCKGG